jgi:hypothetical protein
MAKKTINRNAFNEKLIHRYFFERIYLDVDIRKTLVPDFLKNKISKLNLVVPEHTQEYNGYRSDFTLYFKNDDSPYPVEIKWKSSDFNKKNQIDALVKHNGYLVAFDEPSDPKIPHVCLDKQDFQAWLIERVETLWEEALSAKVKTKIGSKVWVVALRGDSARINFARMLKRSGSKTNFWAFKNDLKAMGNILHLEQGDEMIFLFIKTRGNERSGMIPNSNNTLELNEVFITKIDDPYYMVLDGEQSAFFEKDPPPPINQRIWPHFFNFKILESFKFNSIELSRRKMSNDLKAKIADSSNHGGVLMEISKMDSSYLKGQIRIKNKAPNKT